VILRPFGTGEDVNRSGGDAPINREFKRPGYHCGLADLAGHWPDEWSFSAAN
jgi:hypothetical protein